MLNLIVMWFHLFPCLYLISLSFCYHTDSSSFFGGCVNKYAMQILKALFHIQEKRKWFDNHGPNCTALNWAEIRIYTICKISSTKRYTSKLMWIGSEKLVLSTWQEYGRDFQTNSVTPLTDLSWRHRETIFIQIERLLFSLPAVLTDTSQPLDYLKLLRLSTEAISHVVLERDKWRLDIEHTTFLVLLLASIASPDISLGVQKKS
jgi:hypothetical protein